MASSDRTPLGLRRNDPDETAGRLLYRQLAETEARRSLARNRRVRIAETPTPAAGHEASGLAAQRNTAGRDINARTQSPPNGTNQPDHQSNGSLK